MTITWTRRHRGHYTSADGRFEIVRGPEGWQIAERRPVYRILGDESTLRDAKQAVTGRLRG